MLKRILKLPSGSISISILSVVAFLAVFGPLLAPYSAFDGSEDILAAPSTEHLLGTDYLGRDTLSRLLSAAPLSVFSAVLVGAIALVVGVIPRILSVYLGRAFEWASLRDVDTLLAFPILIFSISITALLCYSIIPAMCAVGFLTSEVKNLTAHIAGIMLLPNNAVIA